MNKGNFKKLVVYYSFEGNTRLIAQTIAAAISADLLEIKPEQELKIHGFMKYFWGGKQVMMKEKPVLAKLAVDPDAYDLIFIGTPVWAFSYAPPFRTFFEQVKLKGKKIALFCTNEGGLGKTLGNMRRELEGNEVLGEMEYVKPLKNKTESELKAKEWARRIVNSLE